MFKLFVPILVFAFYAHSATAQWERIADFGGPATDGAVSFIIDGVAYVGGGPSVSAFYKFDPATESWMKRADVGGGPRGWAFGFAINGKGYIGGGDPTGSFQLVKDFWEYNPASDSWKQLGDFPGGNRDAMFSFSINGVGYAGAGFDGSASYNDFWSYDPATDTWTNIGTYPGGAVLFPVSFIIDGKAYVGTGTAIPEVDTFFEYNPSTNQWKQLPDFPGGPRQAAVAFAAGGKGYMGGGLNGPYQSATQYTDFYEYDPAANAWTKWDDGDFPIDNLSWSTAFVINDIAYLGTGASVPQFEFTRRFYKYVFGGLLEHQLDASGMLDMGSLLTGETRDTTLTIANTGKKPVIISGMSLEGNGASAYALQALVLPYTLDTGNSVNVTVSFSPADAELYEAVLRIQSDASNGPVMDVPIKGLGQVLLPSLALSSTQLLFGEVETGTHKDTTIRLTNTGLAMLTVTGIVIENDGAGSFSLPGLNLPMTISAGEWENVTVRFSPGSADNFQGRFVVLSDASNGEQTAALAGAGRASSGVLVTSLDALDFGVVEVTTKRDMVLTLSNSGTDAISISMVQIDGDTAGVFELAPMQTPAVLGPGATMEISVSYSPAFPVQHEASLRIESDATNGAVRLVALTGQGGIPFVPRLELSRTIIEFGDIETGKSGVEMLSMKNTGNAPVSVSEMRIVGNNDGVFNASGAGVPGMLAPNATADATLRFQPLQTGVFTATLRLTTDIPGYETMDIELSGNGVQPTSVRSSYPVEHRAVEIYPNPVRQGGVVNLSLDVLPGERIAAALYTIDGRLVHTFELSALSSRTASFRLPAGLSEGHFYLRIDTNARHRAIRIHIQRP